MKENFCQAERTLVTNGRYRFERDYPVTFSSDGLGAVDSRLGVEGVIRVEEDGDFIVFEDLDINVDAVQLGSNTISFSSTAPVDGLRLETRPIGNSCDVGYGTGRYFSVWDSINMDINGASYGLVKGLFPTRDLTLYDVLDQPILESTPFHNQGTISRVHDLDGSLWNELEYSVHFDGAYSISRIESRSVPEPSSGFTFLVSLLLMHRLRDRRQPIWW